MIPVAPLANRVVDVTIKSAAELWWAASIAIPLVAARAALEAIVFNADRLGILSFIVGIFVF